MAARTYLNILERTLTDDFSLERLHGLWSLDRPGVMWRHDVDHRPDLALRMAEMEHERGIRAIYYLQAEDDVQELTLALTSLGHALGTHVDVALPREAPITPFELTRACERQAVRGCAFGTRVSLHRPPHRAVWRDIPGFDHALSPEWRGRYSSDSRQRFRTDPVRLLRSGGPAQINLHPEWWLLPADEADALRREHEAYAGRMQAYPVENGPGVAETEP